MLSSVQAGQNTDDYVKQLLDQRTARTDFRFSTPSDFSDTPSVYSRSFFSPCPQNNGGPVSPVNGYTSHDHITPGNIPSLDPDDTNDSSPRGPNRAAVHENHEAEEDLDVETMSHMSILGPKMRFHSRAPWETEEDTLSEGDETASQLESPAKSRFFNFVPSSPRIGNLVGRPSAESTRSEATRKMSVGGTASKGRSSCQNTQSKCNISDAFLGRSCHGGSGPDVMQQSLYSRQSQSSTSTSSPPLSISPNQRFSVDEQTVEFESRSKDSVSIFRESSMSSEPHPYANPDLMAYATESDESLSSRAPVDVVGSGSTTLTESSLTSSASKCDTVSNLTQTISTTSFAPRKSSLTTRHGVQISTPVAVMGHTLQGDKGQRSNTLPPSLPGVQKLPGWMEKVNTPGFSLISLEEARAQRAKNTTQQTLVEALPSVSLNRNPAYLDPDNAAQNDKSLQHSTIIQRTRARSISAGTKAKNVLHSAVRVHGKSDKREDESDSQGNSPVAPGKSLKHKKSGFMRLLVGSKASEREERAQPPPVPVLPRAYEPQSYPHRSHSKLHRVPVPELSAHDVANAKDISAKSAFSQKRTPPPLSISSNGINNTAHAVGTPIEISPRAQSVLMDSPESPWTDKSPHSAPAHVLGFPALKLRPVSTLFSAQFSEHLTKRESSPELDSDTPRTSSPATPLSFGPSIHELTRAIPGATSLEDQSDVIRALQEQIISSKLTWQRQIWELEGQVRDLKLEVEDLKAAKEDYCEACGRGKPCDGISATNLSADAQQSKTSVVNRPRARTGISSSRFGSSTA